MSNQHFDIIIVGGGMVGATAVLALADLNLKIALIEPIAPELDTSSSFDQRAVALSASSVAIFKSLGVWQKIKPLAESIKKIHISDKGRFGFARLDAKDYPVEALGEVIPLDQTGPLLWQTIDELDNVEVFCPCNLVAINSMKPKVDSDPLTIVISSKRGERVELSTNLLLGSDGTFSTTAQLAQIDSTREEYQQRAIIANISTEKDHNNCAFERFTENGPLALLPLTRSRMSLVWCQKEAEFESTMELNDQQFVEKLQMEFGYRLGRITKVGERNQYPLALQLAKKPFKNRVLLLGNSAHTLHPIAGQGFNIGLRDVAALRDAVENTLDNSTAKTASLLGSSQFLENYVESRRADWEQTIFATDSLVRIFSHDFLGLAILRDKALNIFDKVPLVKEKLAYSAMGFSGESAKLTRGLKLSDS